MDLIEATEDRIVRKIGGQDYTFHFLTAHDRAELLRADLATRQAAWKSRRERLIENMELAKLDGPQRFAQLEDFEDQTPQSVSLMDWIEYVNSPINEVAIFERSLKPAHGEKAGELAKLAIISIEDKAKLCGLVVPKEEKNASKPDNPSGEVSDPNAIPATYGN